MSSFLRSHTGHKTRVLTLCLGSSLTLLACAADDTTSSDVTAKPAVTTSKIPPSERFDLSHWSLTLPEDKDDNGRADDIQVDELQTYIHPDFFYLDNQGHLVFTSPNKGAKTRTSGNTRSELRYLLGASDPSIKTYAHGNNFSLASRSNAAEFAAIGGKMEATLHVDHTPLVVNKPHETSAFAVVIGQIHAINYRQKIDTGYGYGNEPLKIFYKKWPNHDTGSVYWNYERNLHPANTNRKDISYPVWGNARTNSADPGANGIALGESFSYTVNVYQDTMYLTFESEGHDTIRHEINLANNVDANGEIDTADNPGGYTEDGHYFKAGVYNQCRASRKKGEKVARCNGTGDWSIDEPNGDYVQASFSRLVISAADPQ